MKLSLPLIASLLLAVGCKTDKQESSAGSAASEAAEPVHKGRSGKIDLPAPRQPSANGDEAPSLPDQGQPPGDDADRRARREERRKQRMAELDKDGDGQISDAEREAARKARMDQMAARLDADGDGKITVDEFKQSPMGRRMTDITTIDTNKDGVISPEELQKQMDDMRARGWGRSGGRGWGPARDPSDKPAPEGDKPAQP